MIAALDDLPLPEADELVVVVGPTATGKTELALALARKWDAEIVGADSVQIYRRFDVGSGKPTEEERARAPHHLVDLLDPLEPIDAARFAELAERAIDDIRARGRTPIVCGGTFLWIKALVFGLAPTPAADPEVRRRHADRAASLGRAALHHDLALVDPESAARLDPNDLVRVSRALEIYELTGRPQAEWFREHGFSTPRHRARFIGVERPREELDRRIEARTRGWLAAGWRDEVEALLADGFGAARAMGSVGYKQVASHLRGELDADELASAIVRATRVFVRRQRTWLRDQPVTWLPPGP
jgi:tRNA dimethylallyltransferase